MVVVLVDLDECQAEALTALLLLPSQDPSCLLLRTNELPRGSPLVTKALGPASKTGGKGRVAVLEYAGQAAAGAAEGKPGMTVVRDLEAIGELRFGGMD